MGRPGKMIPPGYYRALDDNGEYHLYPVEDEEAEDRRYLNKRTGIALQVATLCMRVTSRIQAGEEVCSKLSSPHPPDIQIGDPALGNIASETCNPFHRREDTENITAGNTALTTHLVKKGNRGMFRENTTSRTPMCLTRNR